MFKKELIQKMNDYDLVKIHIIQQEDKYSIRQIHGNVLLSEIESLVENNPNGTVFAVMLNDDIKGYYCFQKDKYNVLKLIDKNFSNDIDEELRIFFDKKAFAAAQKNVYFYGKINSIAAAKINWREIIVGIAIFISGLILGYTLFSNIETQLLLAIFLGFILSSAFITIETLLEKQFEKVESLSGKEKLTKKTLLEKCKGLLYSLEGFVIGFTIGFILFDRKTILIRLCTSILCGCVTELGFSLIENIKKRNL